MEAKAFEYGGRTLPARITMGALRRFHRETGRDFLTLGASIGAEDLGVLLWCALTAECRVEGVDFTDSLDDFLDRVTPDEVSAWYNATPDTQAAEADPETAKKKD